MVTGGVAAVEGPPDGGPFLYPKQKCCATRYSVLCFIYRNKPIPPEGKTMNTKSIARQAGVTTAAVNCTARDLGLEMYYNETNRNWVIQSVRESRQLIEMLAGN